MGLNDGLIFRALSQKDIILLEKWYNRTDCFGYATGFKDFSEIKARLMEPVMANRLTSMICLGEENQTVGFVYGEVKVLGINKVLWIHILIIEPMFQQKGYGTCAINKLIRFANSQYGPLTCIAAVSYKNSKGLSFWNKLGFTPSVDLEKSLHQFGSSDVAILKRNIK